MGVEGLGEVLVCVFTKGVETEFLLLCVGEAVAVGVDLVGIRFEIFLLAVGETVAVGVGVERIGVEKLLLEIGGAVVVRIDEGDLVLRGGDVVEIVGLVFNGEDVWMAVLVCGEGGCAEVVLLLGGLYDFIGPGTGAVGGLFDVVAVVTEIAYVDVAVGVGGDVV